jgi:uncharacterized protein
VSDFWLWWAALFVVGWAVAFINSIAGGGSILSLPLLLFLGLPGSVANGTNRFAIFWGNAFAFYGLYRKGRYDGAILSAVLAPVVFGAIGGAFLAVYIPDMWFRPFLALTILVVSVLSILPQHKGAGPRELPQKRAGRWGLAVLFFIVGLYGGFIQIGMGFVLIYAFSRATGLGLVEVNALKSLVGFCFIFFSLLIFLFYGKIDWGMALPLALGSASGGYLGGVFQVKKGEKWVRLAIPFMGFVLALKILWDLWQSLS